MSEHEAEDMLSGMSPEAKKGLLSKMVSSLMSGMSEAERREMLQSALLGQRENVQLSSMVER